MVYRTGTLLNVNVPKGVPKGIHITKQGFKDAHPVITEHIDPRGKPYYWIGENRKGFKAEGGTDFESIDDGFVSVTPMRSDLTNHMVIERSQVLGKLGMDEYKIGRERMVERLRSHYNIADERVLDVMSRIPRHEFVPEALKFQAYRDNALPISSKQTISQPYIVARMTELLELTPSDKVLEIGSGSGYQTSILSRLSRVVYAIERVPALARQTSEMVDALGLKNVTVSESDGTEGWEIYAPFNAILVAAGGPGIPEPLAEQLTVGGKLVIPVGKTPESQVLHRVIRTSNGFVTENHGKCSFVPLIGAHGWEQN